MVKIGENRYSLFQFIKWLNRKLMDVKSTTIAMHCSPIPLFPSMMLFSAHLTSTVAVAVGIQCSVSHSTIYVTLMANNEIKNIINTQTLMTCA